MLARCVSSVARRSAFCTRALSSTGGDRSGAPHADDAIGDDVEARIYERAFAQYLRKKAGAYGSMNSPPDETLLARKHKERVVRMWEQLFRMKQLPDLIVCLSHSDDIAREAAAAGIPTISPVGITQPSDNVTYAIPISEDAPGVKAELLGVYHNAVRLGANAARRRATPTGVQILLDAAGHGSKAELVAARRAWAAAEDAAAVERLAFERSHAQRSPRGGDLAWGPEARRDAFRRRAVSAAVAAELESRRRPSFQPRGGAGAVAAELESRRRPSFQPRGGAGAGGGGGAGGGSGGGGAGRSRPASRDASVAPEQPAAADSN
jgi:hypothetical protein